MNISFSKISSVKNIKEVKGKRVIVRGSLNVPLQGKKVADDFRLRRMLPTLEYLQKKGAKIILIGHIGRDPKETLLPVADHFNIVLGKTVGFAPKLYAKDLHSRIENLGEGQILMLENVRRFPAETKGGENFAKHLASFGDVYVNDAFAASHRSHASITGIPKILPSYAGLLFLEEVKHLAKVLTPKHPFLFIIGGAKFETKVPLLRKFQKISDTVFVGGAIANDLLKAKGYEVGRSLVGKPLPYANELAKKKNVILPIDVITDKKEKKLSENVKKTDAIMDAGSKTIKQIEKEIQGSKFILWNGPLGLYEKGFDRASKKLLKAISRSKVFSIIGGGDTTALVSKMKMEDAFGFVSTGGGAMLEFLQDGTLPGIKILGKKNRD